MPMCSSRVLFGLELIARAWSRDRLSRADVFDSSPVGGFKYERCVRYISTDEQNHSGSIVSPFILILMEIKFLKARY